MASHVPADLLEALRSDEVALSAFEKLPPAHQEDIAGWVEGAQHPAHRAQRVELAIRLLVESDRGESSFEAKKLRDDHS